MSWSKTSIDLPLLNGIDDILASLNAGASSLETILGTASVGLDAAKVLYQATSDPFNFLFEALLTEIENLINDIYNSSASVLVVNPLTSGNSVVEEIEGSILNTEDPFTFQGMQVQVNNKAVNYSFDPHGIPLMTPTQCINEMISSFDDLGDANRPNISTSGQVAAFGVIATAPDLRGFIPLVNNILKVLNIQPFVNILNDILRKANLDIDGNSRTVSTSRQPDWYSARLSSISALGTQRDQLLKVLNLTRGYVQTADQAIVALADTIQRKIDNLLNIVSDFNDLITQLRSVAAASGVWSFSLPKSTGGTEFIKERLRVSANDPDVANTDIFRLNSGYTIGVLFVGGGASLTAVETIRSLMFSTAEVVRGEFFNEIQVLTFSDVPDEGTFRIEFNGEETRDFNFDIQAAQIQAFMRADLNSLSDIEVQGNTTDGFTFNFAGSDGQKDQPEITLNDAGADEVQKITFTEKPDSGSFKLRYNPNDGSAIEESSLINFNATAATVQSALEFIFGIGNISVTGSFTSGFLITWLNLYEKTNISVLSYSSTLKRQTRSTGIKVSRQNKGRVAANNLKRATLPVTHTVITTRQGRKI